MKLDAETYNRLRGQVTFLLSVVELLANSIDRESGAARTARRAVELTRSAIATAETVAEAYASISNELSALQEQIERLQKEARPPTSVEWEALRSELESASQRIAAIDPLDGSASA